MTLELTGNCSTTYETHESNQEIISEYTFTIKDTENKGVEYYVEAYFTGQHDTYCIRVFKLTEDESLPTDTNNICVAYLDSCGGGCADEEVNTGIEELDTLITDTLFGEDGVIIPF